MGKIPVLRLSALQSASNICRGITVMLFKVLPVFIILTSTKGGKMFPQWIGKDPVSECLLRRTMYHHLTGKCHPPLDQGPCSPGELLLPDSPPGTLKCSPLSLPESCSANIQPDGEVEVECEEELDMMYKRGQCGEGELLLPCNFRENTRPCAEGRTAWLSEDGYYRCLLTTPSVLNCQFGTLT